MLRVSQAPARRFVWNAAALTSAPDDALFDPEAWHAAGRVRGTAEGRGSAYFLNVASGGSWVLRHYRRGGLVARVNGDRYLWTGADRSRPERELRILADLVADELPVPVPVAARVTRQGLFYRGDLITECIADARPLADHLIKAALPNERWQALGALIARFHACGVWHADLNARNVLIDGAQRFHLIDFDRARRRGPGGWRRANLARLRRSLDKFAAGPGIHFVAADWVALRGGYQSVLAGAL